jgi:CRP/FNR family transcriptional regulator, cyclic AMP receptor protein
MWGGRWVLVWENPGGVAAWSARCGWVVVDGVVFLWMVLGEHRMIELLGPGDVVGVPAAEEAPGLGAMVSVLAASDVVLLGLCMSFLRAAQRWPSLLWTVLARREAQRERLAVQGLSGHFPRAQTRVLLMLWHLAQRCGRVTPEGLVVPLALTRALLGELTGARRSTVTLAVSARVAGPDSPSAGQVLGDQRGR